VLLDADRQVAQDVLVDALQALDLEPWRPKGRRRSSALKCALRFFAHPVVRVLTPQYSDLAIFAAQLLDHTLVLGGELFNLLCGQILPRQEDVFVEWHGMPFRCAWPAPARRPFVPCFGKARKLRRREHGTPGD